MIPVDYDLECSVLWWIAEDPDARTLFFEELERRDLWDPVHRQLFTLLRDLWRAGRLRHGYEIRGVEVVHVWPGLAEGWRAELEAIIESGGVHIYLSARGAEAVSTLRDLTKRRAILAAAERVLAGEQIAEPLLDFLLRDEGAAA